MALLEDTDPLLMEVRQITIELNRHSLCYIGLVGKIEKATHIDLNQDGRIGGGAAYHHRP